MQAIDVSGRIRELSPPQKRELARRLAVTGVMHLTPVAFPRIEGEPLPVSFAQEALLLAHAANPGDANFNTFLALRLSGTLDGAALLAAISMLTERHSALRTGFVLRDGQICQWTPAAVQTQVRVADITAVADAESRARALARTETRRPFDPFEGEVMRTLLLRVSDQVHVLILTVHHVACDRWSAKIIARELPLLYQAARAGKPDPLPPAEFQYADFAAWQRQRVGGEALRRDAEYWRGQLVPPPPILRMGDRTVAAGARLDAGQISTVLPARLVRDIDALSGREGTTVFMTTLAAFKVLLRIISGETDVCVATPVTNRKGAHTAGVVGLFLNMVMIRSRASDALTFRQFLRRVRQTCTDAFDHSELPFEVVARECGFDRAGRVHVPYSVVFTLNDEHEPAAGREAGSLSGLAVVPVHVDTGGVVSELAIHLERQGSRLSCLLSYDRSVMAEDRAGRILQFFIILLKAVVSRPDVLLTEFSLGSSPPARGQLPRPRPRRSSSSHCADPADCGLPDLFRNALRKAAGRAAVVHEKEVLTYAALDARSTQLAADLLARGVARGDRVAVLLRRSTQFIVAVLAVLKARAAYVPVDPREPAARARRMLQTAGVRLLVTVADHLPAAAGLDAEVVLLGAGENAAAAPSRSGAQFRVHPLDLACVFFTSGSTGEPKGVAVPHSAITRLVRDRTYFPFSAGIRIAHFSNVAFDAATFEIWGSLLNGGTVVVLDDDDILSPRRFRERLSEGRIGGLFITTALFTRMAQSDPTIFAGLEALLVGGEAADPPTLYKVASHPQAGTVSNIYGPTEGTTFSTCHRVDPGGPLPCRVPIGGPLAEVRCYVLDRAMQPVPTGFAGELYIGGTGLAWGYIGRPALTAERFVPDPHSGIPGARLYRTGDLVVRLASGALDFMGRKDAQIKLRGHRIELDEVRLALGRMLPDAEIAVALKELHGRERALVAYVCTDRQISSQELRTAARSQLPEFMVPAAFVRMSTLPVNPNGKVDVDLLPAPALREREYAEPAGPLERRVAAVWAAVLGVEHVGRNDEFFECGGNSLTAMQIAAELGKQSGIDLSLTAILEHPTVAGMAELLAAAAASAWVADDPTKSVLAHDESARFDPFPMTDLQQAYWIGRTAQLDLGNVAATAYLELEGEGLDLQRLSEALNTVICRHDALRTVATVSGSQRVLSDVERFRIPVTCLRGLTEAQERRQLEVIRERLAGLVRPANQWPLFDLRVTLRRSGPPRLHVCIEAIVADAWSWRLIIHELGRLYHDPATGLPELPITFRDWVVHQRRNASSASYLRSVEYWRGRAADFPQPPQLPVSARREAAPVFRRRSLAMAAGCWSAMREGAMRSGVTPSTAVLCAFADVIDLWSAKSRFALNITSFNRPPVHPALANIVGDFTTTILLEVRAGDGGTFAERAARLQRRIWSDLDHSEVSSVEVTRGLRRSGGQAELIYPIVFTSLLGLPLPPGAESRLTFTSPFSISRTPQVWLDCQVYENARAELCINWDALEGIFEAGVLDDMWAAFEALLSLMAQKGSWSSKTLPSLPPWQRKLFAEVNDTEAPVPGGLLQDAFFARAARQPGLPAVSSSRRTLSYGELAGFSAALAGEIQAAREVRRRMVGICMEKGWEQVLAVLATLEADCAYLPIDPELPAARVEQLLAKGEVTLVLTQSWLRREWPRGVRSVDVDLWSRTARRPRASREAEESRRLAYVIFTSGSTGEPKGVMITHGAAMNTIADLIQRFRIRSDDRVLGLSNLGFDLSVFDIFGTFSAGACLVIPDAALARDPRHWSELVQRHGVTIWNSVPAAMSLLTESLDSRKESLPESLRLVMLSGDWIPAALAASLRAARESLEIVSLGGATEASIWSIVYPIGTISPDWPSIPYGRPLANQRFHVLDDRLERKPVWAEGQLAIEGEGLAVGYLGDPDLTARKFVHLESGARVYLTGDRGRYLPGGDIQFLGRDDQQVKINGYRIELGEIESHLAAHADVADAIVLAGAHRRDVRHLVAFVRPRDGAGFSASGLRAHLVERLPDYMVPAAMVPCAEFPLNSNGKVDRARLWATYLAQPRDAASTSGPWGALETMICQCFAAELGIEAVAPDENFFALGGESFVALGIVAKLKALTGQEVALRDLFRAPSPRELASRLAAARHPSAAPGANGPAASQREVVTGVIE
jgi:amino acid adenylation domain-containing protein